MAPTEGEGAEHRRDAGTQGNDLRGQLDQSPGIASTPQKQIAAHRASARLVKYDRARKALAEAKAVDEVLNVHDQARAREHYARIANDRQLEADAHEIRMRAKRKLGDLIKAQSLWPAGRCRRTLQPRSGRSPSDPAAQWTRAMRGPAFFAYSDNYLIDVEVGALNRVYDFCDGCQRERPFGA